MPADLTMAITHAQSIIGWQENLMGEDMPPEWMWPLPDELDDWFTAVKKRHDAKYGDSDGDDDEGADMTQNELSRGRR